MSAAYKIRATAVVLLAVLLSGCPSPPRREPPPAPTAPEQQPPRLQREGQAFRIDSEASLLTVLVYRGGPLARAGHNHVVASHDLTGMAYVPNDVTHASFDVRIPVNALVVDEEDLRAREGPDFPAEVPEEAKDGTKRNMLGADLLNGDRYPEILLQSEAIHKMPDGLQAQIRIIVRDQAYSFLVPLQYQVDGNELRVSGEMPLKQTEIGLTPFSLFGGALKVLDDIKVKFRVVAKAESP